MTECARIGTALQLAAQLFLRYNVVEIYHVHLLLVDNNKMSQRIMHKLLKSDYNTTTVESLCEAKIKLARG